MTRDDTNDAAGDYVYLLNEAQDAMYVGIMDTLFGKAPNRVVQIDGKPVLLEDVLFEATDISGAPDGPYVMRYLMDRAHAGDKEAMGIIARLVEAYANANAKVES